MKKVISIFILIAFVITSCDNTQDVTTLNSPMTEVATEKPKDKKVNSSDVFSAEELEIMSGGNSEGKKGGKKNQVSQQVTQAAESDVLVNNGGGSFSITYSGSNLVWHFFRGSDSLAANGNVYPTASQSFYQNPVTSWTSNFTRTFYQSVLVYGSTTPDANGVVGADWVFRYTNVVQ